MALFDLQAAFDLPLDHYQRTLAERALTDGGAPFDPRDRARFTAGVRDVWARYQAACRQPAPGLQRPLHGLDRLIYERRRQEHIDDVTLPAQRRTSLIRSLDRLNVVVGGYWWFFQALTTHLRGLPAGTISVLDVGSGHGALPIRLQRKARLGAHTLRVVGSDLEPAYVDEARRAAREHEVDVEFRQLDALRLDELDEQFDVITCTQTVHHFPPELLAGLLVSARAHARRGVLFFDARRSSLTLLGASVLTLAVSGDTMLLHDGLVSVRRMYSPAELELLARCAPGGEHFVGRNFGPQYVTVQAFTDGR